MKNALDQRFLGAVVVVAGTLGIMRDACAQSEQSTPPTIVVPNVSSAAENQWPVLMDAEEPGIVLYRVFDPVASRVPHPGIVNVGDEMAEMVCRLPCNVPHQWLLEDAFLFGGRNTAPSATFRLGVGDRTRAFRVTKGERESAEDGTGLIFIGSIPLAFGLFALPWSLATAEDTASRDAARPTKPTVEESYRREVMIAGVASLVLGGIAIGVGIPLYRKGKTTFLQFDPQTNALRF